MQTTRAEKTYRVSDEQSHRVFLEAIRDGKFTWADANELDRFRQKLNNNTMCEIIVSSTGTMRIA